MKVTMKILQVFFASATMLVRPGCGKGTKMMRMGGALERFLEGLEIKQELSHEQVAYILNHCIESEYMFDNRAERWRHANTEYTSVSCADLMVQYLNTEIANGRMSRETGLYVASMFHLDLDGRKDRYHALAIRHAPRNYSQGNGIVQFQGNANFSPPRGSDNRYNGIWGFVTGSRRYVLQGHSEGLDIIDITESSTPVRVQFIPMPGGNVWRDVDTFTDRRSSKTYAYVGAQGGTGYSFWGDAEGSSDLWVVDLSYLSGTSPHTAGSNPIPPQRITNLGETDMAHTLYVHQDLGLLVLNSANPQDGCRIFDLFSDPTSPAYLASYLDDCHDGLIVSNFESPYLVGGPKDVMLVADGNTGRFRLVDVSDIREGATFSLLGETQRMGSYAYAHSVAYFERGESKYMVVFDELHSYDIAIHDITDPAHIRLLGTLQHATDDAGDDHPWSASSPVHNGQVVGNYLVVAYYEAGFRVFDISNPALPVEVGKYETYIEPDNWWEIGDGFNGAWNLYVFRDGEIAVSDQQSGTYIFTLAESYSGASPTAPAPVYLPVSSPIQSTSPACTDVPGWYVTLTSIDCDFFSLVGCNDFFGEAYGHTPFTACCVCGGGIYEYAPDNDEPTPSGSFNIALLNMGTNTRYDTYFESAATRLMTLLSSTSFEDVPAGIFPDLFDGFFDQTVDVAVDDILIGYDISYIDGYANVLGYAGPTALIANEHRGVSRVVAGIMKFESLDFLFMSNQDIEIVILHEMLHVLGFGTTVWEEAECAGGCFQTGRNTRYTCRVAQQKYQELFQGLSPSLLVDGESCGHFAEESFNSASTSEIATPYFEQHKRQPLSIVTLGALEDIGYQVRYELADPYFDGPVRRRELLPEGSFASMIPTMNFTLHNRVLPPTFTVVDGMALQGTANQNSLQSGQNVATSVSQSLSPAEEQASQIPNGDAPQSMARNDGIWGWISRCFVVSSLLIIATGTLS